jgi:hypothetical protein
MDYVLDLDLDFFVWPVKRDQCDHVRLPKNECQYLASQEKVRQFLEACCHLTQSTKIPGRQLREHVEAFETWREWLHDGQISKPFGVVHVDGHGDLGAGWNLTFSYMDELLALPVCDRSTPFIGEKWLNSGNYLLGAIANRWINRLAYVYPTNPISREDCPPTGDLPPQCFFEDDWRSKKIQLRKYDRQARMQAKPVPKSAEPCVPFEVIPDSSFNFEQFTHMVVAQSPKYTPKRADRLLRVIADYFSPV